MEIPVIQRFFVAVGLAMVFAPAPPFGQTRDDKPQTAAHAQQPSSTSPGPEHAFLAKRAGEYARVIKFIGQSGMDRYLEDIRHPWRAVQFEENHDTVLDRPSKACGSTATIPRRDDTKP